MILLRLGKIAMNNYSYDDLQLQQNETFDVTIMAKMM